MRFVVGEKGKALYVREGHPMWNDRVGREMLVTAVGPHAGKGKGGCEWTYDYQVTCCDDGVSFHCMDEDLEKAYDGNTKTSWDTLAGIWQPQKEKSPC